mmetsp:Transcript_59081/g.133777  ORF Transcript_59081/g.133777 Transcript_59081/m.133777 type:complete len:236 (+) Transcript_59081:90-797(+)|eukprot:CAMPEP_0172639568 /NCGR_PEP_ID=MMETSP1068-20121228/219000_1 /TAXON_ID=35684 /ORGANISM="Pseudopedinella elastica, Strain CCMP716" /LENGTH=235 /DNA_ID=CAMNT_0013452751 /DNA_START=88 /DNA_END=795 /DNA_ORIENTATION=-
MRWTRLLAVFFRAVNALAFVAHVPSSPASLNLERRRAHQLVGGEPPAVSRRTGLNGVFAAGLATLAGATGSPAVALAASGDPCATCATPAYTPSTLIATPSGLKYIVRREGSGPTPQRAQKVRAHYTLWLDGFNGKEQVDSSRAGKRGSWLPGGGPFAFYAGTGGVIKGWDEAILSMKVGEVRQLIVPADLGYGSRGARGAIPPDSTLYFELELMGMGDLELNENQKQWLAEHPA